MKRVSSILSGLLLLCTLLTGCSMEETASSLYDMVSDDLIAMEENTDTAPDVPKKTQKTTAQEDSSSWDWNDEWLDADEDAVEASADYSEAEAYETEVTIAEDGIYTSKEDVSLYIHVYEHLPDNFITKKEAQSLGWSGGSLEPYAPGKCIGGSRFGNYEGQLPTAKGRTYTECDIDTLGAKSRGAKRIVFSNDGLIYYTDDHYETFTLLYGEETP